MFQSVHQTMNIITPGRSSMNPLHHCLQGDRCSLEGHQGPQQDELRVPSPLTAWSGRKGMECPCVLHCRNTSIDFHFVFPAMTGVLAELCVVSSWSGQFLSACSWEGLVHLKITVVSQHLVPIAQCSLHWIM